MASDALIEFLRQVGSALAAGARALFAAAHRARGRLAVIAVVSVVAYALYHHRPFATVPRGEILTRTNLIDGSVLAYTEGTVLVVPGVHQSRRFSIRDQVYRTTENARATGPAPFQSNEGLSIGVDLTVRCAVDRGRIARMSKEYPDDLNTDLVQPTVQGIVFPARHTVREIFSDRRAQIQQEITDQLKPKLRRFEVLRLDDLALVRQASTPELLRDFGRWADIAWRRDSLALH